MRNMMKECERNQARKPWTRHIRMGVLPLLLAMACSLAAANQNSTAPAQAQPQFQQLIHSLAGPDLFRAYCASCHGSDAKGHGPAAAALRARVPDLTRLAKNNGGRFPAARVRKTIMGDEVIASHGSREMPIWGPIFHQVEEDVDRGNVRLENLVQYLDSIQSLSADVPADKPAGATPTASNSTTAETRPRVIYPGAT